jgi:predicted acyl esterase
VGLCGISYYAINQWHVAALQPPHLAAILPWEGAADHYRDMTRHGGILSNGFFDGWYPRQVLSVQHGRGRRGPTSAWVDDGLVTGPESLPDEELAANRVDYLGLLREHPFDDEWHRSRSAELERIEVPLLSAGNWGGLGLHNRGNFEGFHRSASTRKWLEVHTGRHEEAFYTPEGRALQRSFFDYALRGIEAGWSMQPRVSLTVRHADGTTRRRGEDEWPLARTRWEHWYLDAERGALAPGRPPEQTGSAGFDSARGDLTFTSPPLAAPLEITGPVHASLFADTSGSDADLFLTLRAFAPDGTEITFKGANDPRAPLSQGWLRMSHRALDPARSLPWRPWHPHTHAEPVRSGEAYELAVELWPTCIVLPAGYRLALTIAGQDFARPGDGPFFGSGPFRHDDPNDRPTASTMRIHTGGRTAAHLVLPVIP